MTDSRDYNPFAATILIMMMAFVFCASASHYATGGHGNLLGAGGKWIGHHVTEQFLGAVSLLLLPLCVAMTWRVYHKKPLRAWFVRAIACLPWLLLAAIFLEVAFYDSTFSIGGTYPRFVAEWFSTRLPRTAALIALATSMTAYGLLVFIGLFKSNTSLFRNF